jgi:hypothetical protein
MKEHMMSHYHSDFQIQSERRRGEMAEAAVQRQLKEAKRAGLVIAPLIDFQRLNLSRFAVALARGLGWLGSQLSTWSCVLSTRYAPVVTRPEGQKSAAD